MTRFDQNAHNNLRQRIAIQQLGEQADTVTRADLMWTNTSKSDWIEDTTGQKKFSLRKKIDPDFTTLRTLIDLIGMFEYNTDGTPTLRIRVRAGSKTLFDCGAVTLGSGVSGKQALIHAQVSCIGQGSSGKARTALMAGRFDDDHISLVAQDEIPFDWSAQHEWCFSAQWSAAHASNKVRLERFTVRLRQADGAVEDVS